MKITIAERLHPFSHERGIRFLLPHTSLVIQVFPTRLFFADLKGRIAPFSLSFECKGPMPLTATLDLQQEHLLISAESREGYIRYRIKREEKGVALTLEKAPGGKLRCFPSYLLETLILFKEEPLLLPFPLDEEKQPANKERLSLGMHKSQEWEKIRRRADFKEIFPLWFALSRCIPPSHGKEIPRIGNYTLLEECRTAIQKGKKEEILALFTPLFLSTFEGVLVPRTFDTEYQGILSSQEISEEGVSPLSLLTSGGELIRALFFQEKGEALAILPCLPPLFSCGRMVSIQAADRYQLDIEWTKKNLRRIRLYARKEGICRLKLPKGISSVRLKRGRNLYTSLAISSDHFCSFPCAKDETLHLDRFKA